LRLYPASWRERYGEEMSALLEQHKITPVTWLDLLAGALDAHLDPNFREERRPTLMEYLDRLKGSSSAVFVAMPVFFFFWYAFILDQGDVAWESLVPRNPIMAVAYPLMQLCAAVAWLTMLGTGAFLIVALATKPGVAEGQNLGRRKLNIVLLALPPLSLLLVYLMGVFRAGDLIPLKAALGLIALVILSPLTFAWVIAQGHLDEPLLRATRVPSTVVGVALVVQVLAVIVCQAVASTQWPGGNWSAQLVIGFVLTALPAAGAALAVIRLFGNRSPAPET